MQRKLSSPAFGNLYAAVGNPPPPAFGIEAQGNGRAGRTNAAAQGNCFCKIYSTQHLLLSVTNSYSYI
jgi:hypothetical protein